MVANVFTTTNNTVGSTGTSQYPSSLFDTASTPNNNKASQSVSSVPEPPSGGMTMIPKTMADCLDQEDPVTALQLLAAASAERATAQAIELQAELNGLVRVLPELLERLATASASSSLSEAATETQIASALDSDHPYAIVAACADSVARTLTTISSGGSEASHEIRQLEREKRHVDAEAASLQTALVLRHQSVRALQSVTASAWLDAAQALQPWLAYQQQQQQQQHQSTSSTTTNNNESSTTTTVEQYAGRDCMERLKSTYDSLTHTLTAQYETAVAKSDLQVLGQLTPILSVLNLEHEGLRLYKDYLDSILNHSMMEAVSGSGDPSKPTNPSPPPFAPMGRVYNTAVSILRHHLPMVSFCLYKADGAVAVMQLVHSHTERAILPILVQHYQRDKQLARVARTASNIYAALEERCTGQQRHQQQSMLMPNMDGSGRGKSSRHSNVDDDTVVGDSDDCGFVQQIGSLSDVDVSMEEAAVCIQHSESYFRFVRQTCLEVNRARRLRHEQAVERARMERERLEWTTGEKAATSPQAAAATTNVDETFINIEHVEYKDLEILPTSTNLIKAVAELGGQYAAIERCLLLASMQRAFVQISETDPRFYRPMSTSTKGGGGGGGGNGAGAESILQTTLVETCWYSARRGTQRSMATGHAGTASAVINFTVECLNDVSLEVLTRRAEELGVHPLKPGEGLLVGSANLFNNASNLLIRQSGASAAGVGLQALPGAKNKDEWIRKQKREEGIARACATMNDLEVAIHHTQQLESLLNAAIDKGFAKESHETEHLRMCVKSFGSVAESFQMASNATIESLESVLKPRIRSIVGDAVGSESTFMGASSVMGVGGKSGDREMVRMNYDLDEETYNLMQLSEGYITRLCLQLDELLQPLHRCLAPRLWDTLLLTVLGTVCKRLETSLRKCQYTALGGFTLDSDMRDLLHYTKEQLHSPDYNGSNVAILKACSALSKLLQISKLLSVDDLDDVLDLISGAKRKGNWDLKLDDAKAFLSLRVEFDSSKIDELLRMPDDD